MRLLRLVGVCVVAALGLSGLDAAGAYSQPPTGVIGWGANGSGQLGNGGSAGVPVPRTTLAEPQNVTAVSAGGSSETEGFSLALARGLVYSWGDNEEGQLGRKASAECECSRKPHAIPNLKDVTAISASPLGEFSLALQETENAQKEKQTTVFGWGSDSFHQLGHYLLAEKSETPTPIYFAGGPLIKAISAGGWAGLALTENEHKETKVMAWGEDTAGELGDGPPTSENSEACHEWKCSKEPVEVKGLEHVLAIAAGEEFDVALVENEGHREVETWGEDSLGQLGRRATEECAFPAEEVPCGTHPEPVPGLTEAALNARFGEERWKVTAVSAGGGFGLALIENEHKETKVMAWGNNNDGQLGYGKGPETCTRAWANETSYECSREPVPVKYLSKVSAVSAGNGSALALSEGEVFAWGAGVSESEECPGIELARKPGKGKVFCDHLASRVGQLTHIDGIAAGSAFGLAYGPGRPSVTGLSPSSGWAEERMTITGNYLTPVTKVMFGESEATNITPISSKEVEVTVPAPPGGKPGKVHVIVTTSGGMLEPSQENSASVFTYHDPDAPEYGRCKKVARGTGKFANAGCTSETGGSYEWEPGVEKAHFTLTGIEGNHEYMVTLETVNKLAVVCWGRPGTGGEGRYSGTKGVTNVVLRFTGCEVEETGPIHACTSAGAEEEEIVTNPLHGELGWTEPGSGIAALALTSAEEAPVAEFECEGYSRPVVVRGVLLVGYSGKMNTMHSEINWQLKETHGKQDPKYWEGEELVLTSNLGGGIFPEQTGIRVTLQQDNEEAIEVNGTV